MTERHQTPAAGRPGAARRPRPGHRLSTTLLALVVPLALVGTAVLVALRWREDLPDPVATHWGPSGPDDFGSLTTFLLVMTALVVVLSAAAWALGVLAGHAASTRRLATGTSSGLAALLATVVLTSLDGQRGLGDAAAAPDADGSIALSLAAGVLVGSLVAWATPGDQPLPATQAPPPGAERLPIAADERAVWFATVTSVPGLVVGGAAVAFTTLTAVLGQLWWMLTVPAAVTVLLLAMSWWTVRVDRSGLHVRSALGLPRTLFPLEEIEVAEAVQVRPLKEFGGWGWRTGVGGRVGVVLRAGEALSVTRTGGRVFVVTVDDAATAAALLNSLAARSRGERSGV